MNVEGLRVKALLVELLVELRLKNRGVAGKSVNVWEEAHPRSTFPKLKKLGEKVKAARPVPLTATVREVV